MLSVAPGCGDDSGSATSTASTSGTGGGTTGSISTTSTGGAETSSSSTSTGSSVDDSTTGSVASDVPPVGPGPARGITVTGVETYQGLRIGATAPDVSPIPGRRTVLRFFVDIDEPLWEKVSPGGRALIARLRVRLPDGAESIVETETFVFRDSADYNVESTVQVVLDPALVVEGAGYRLELDEFHPEVGVLPLPEVDPAYPSDPEAFADLGIGPATGSPPRLRVHLLPYDYQGNCSATVNVDEAVVEQTRSDVQDMYPVTEVTFTIGEPIVWTTPVTDIQQVLADVAARRAADAPDPDVYYAGLIDVCSDCPGCAGGWANFATPTVEDAWLRASINRTYSSFDPEEHARDMARILTHEIGHNHNLFHAPCDDPNGDPGATNPSYPHAAGHIGATGYRASSNELMRPETSYDLMTYCNPTWVSDYTWNLLSSHIQQLGSAVAAGPVAPPRDSLVLMLDDDGTPQSVRRAPINAELAEQFESNDERLMVELDGRAASVGVRHHVSPHGGERMLQLILPAEVDSDADELRVGSRVFAVPSPLH